MQEMQECHSTTKTINQNNAQRKQLEIGKQRDKRGQATHNEYDKHPNRQENAKTDESSPKKPQQIESVRPKSTLPTSL
jgi:hypothetical protein